MPNERYHVQKIVEQHYWLFGEQYNLVTADQRMQKALANYLNILYGSDAPDATLNPGSRGDAANGYFSMRCKKNRGLCWR